ncbi:MAG TPA: adenosine deaminase [Candidatus Baltobacteraceae bacterium]|nr:adenosine deaminase [Candidatus Baltobacteraceae bacterium]
MTTDEFLRALPKIQLHCHLEGTLRASTFLDLAKRHGVALTYRPRSEESHDPSDLYRFANFGEFLLAFAAASRSLAEPADYERLAAEFAQDALEQNVAYAEVFVSPSVWQFFNPEIDVRACMRAIRSALDAHRDLEVKIIVDLTRNFGAESAMRTAQLALDMQEFGVVGIGLGGDESRFPPELFVDAFTFARDRGLHVVAHAGEAAGAQSVRGAVEMLGAERIGHGVRALEDDAVVELLKRRGIPLECAPTSNALTGVVSAGAEHPLVQLDERGVIVTIDADDPAMFRTSITRELEIVQRMTGPDDVVRFTRNAVDAAFAPQEKKAELHARIDAALENRGASRT